MQFKRNLTMMFIFTLLGNPADMLNLQDLYIPDVIRDALSGLATIITPTGDKVYMNLPTAAIPQGFIPALQPEGDVVAIDAVDSGSFGIPTAENHNAYESYLSPYITKRYIDAVVLANGPGGVPGPWAPFSPNQIPIGSVPNENLLGFYPTQRIHAESVAVLSRYRFELCDAYILINLLKQRCHQKKRKLPIDERCIKCDLLLRYDTGQKKVITSEEEANLFSVELDKEVDVGNVLCGKCRRSTRLLSADPNLSSMSHDLQVTSPPDADSADLNLPSTSHGHHETFPQDRDRVERQLSELSNLSASDDVSQATQPLLPSQQPSQQFSQQSSSGTSESQSSQSFGDPSYVVRVREPTHRETIEMPFKRVVVTHKYCCICLVEDKNYVVVPFKARLQVFISSRIFIPKNNRCCPKHLINDRFYVDEIPKLHVVSSKSTIDFDELTLVLNTLSNTCNNSLFDNLSDERIKSLTGFTVEEINTLKNLLISMRNSENRSINQALFAFLFKLRTGNSNSITASIFNIKYEQYLSEYCESVLNAFQKDVFPNKFGAQACSREDLIANHTSPYVYRVKVVYAEHTCFQVTDEDLITTSTRNAYYVPSSSSPVL
uniref:Uncharacterized protein n=1 Tax=Rhodnius prolixus TaxID=13249 RepID=T1HU43_RHOPR